MPRLSVVIPAYNEEKRLPRTLREVGAYLKRQDYSSEVLVVSDGSSDGTAASARALKGEVANLRVLENKENHGKGFVVRQGMLEATGEVRLFMDADNSTSLDHVERMWPELEKGAGAVICSRDIPGSVLAVPQPWVRRRLGDAFNLIVQVFSGLWGMWDTQCGFKAFAARAAEDVFSRAVVDRWAFDVELLAVAKKKGYRVAEVPVTWKNDKDSRVRLGGMVKMLVEVLQIRLNLWRGRYE